MPRCARPRSALSGSAPDRGGCFNICATRWRTPLALLLEAAEHASDVTVLDAGRHYLVNHPTYIKHILLDNNRNYHKDRERFAPLLGAGLLTSDGMFWRRQRRVMQPAFHRERIADATTIMTHTTSAMLERWQPFAKHGHVFDLVPELMRLTLQIVGRALFSTDLSGEADTIGGAFTAALERIAHPPRPILGIWLPTIRNRQFQQALNTLDQTAYRLISERRRSPSAHDDLLTLLLAARDVETGAPLSDREVRDEVLTILFAGQETTATALVWACYLLATHPAAEQRLRAELDTVLGGRTPMVTDLPHLTYTQMIISESLRLYPPAWAFARIAQDDDEIGGHSIPAGARVTVSPYLIHRHPAFWEQPERFEPERFAADRSADRPKLVYMPFGGGPRQCIGNTFALTEAQLILAMVAQTYKLQLLPGYPVEPYPLITLRPRHGLLMTPHTLPT